MYNYSFNIHKKTTLNRDENDVKKGRIDPALLHVKFSSEA